MPKQSNNIVMRNTQGMLGAQVVFKIRKGKSIVSAPPVISKDRTIRESELQVRNRFKQGVLYAKSAMADPAVKAAYQAITTGGQTAYNVALRDAIKPPTVLQILTEEYTGQAGDVLIVQAVDDFKVTKVKVAIHSDKAELIEEGEAIMRTDNLTWTYKATKSLNDLAGISITATATDVPGNEGSLEISFPDN